MRFNSKAWGGIGGLLLVVIVYLVVDSLGDDDAGEVLNGSAFSGAPVGLSGQTFDYSTCTTGADAAASDECALVAVENSLTDYWREEAKVADIFQPERAVRVFHGSISGSCGEATADVGPFYCAADQTIYLDTAFFDAVAGRLGEEAMPFVRAYVVAHEYGHHIQDLLGTMTKPTTRPVPASDAVRLELQADCYAGMWAQAAASTPNADGEVLIDPVTRREVDRDIAAVVAVGAEDLRKRTGGSVRSEPWTRGSASERAHWFWTGMSANGYLSACDTFSASSLD